MLFKVTIPHCYVWMTAGANNRGVLFKKYVEDYLKKTDPDLKLIKIEGMIAICERSGEFEAWSKAYQEAKNSNKKSRTKSR